LNKRAGNKFTHLIWKQLYEPKSLTDGRDAAAVMACGSLFQTRAAAADKAW
jgi:hypothetical protein